MLTNLYILNVLAFLNIKGVNTYNAYLQSIIIQIRLTSLVFKVCLHKISIKRFLFLKLDTVL